MSKLNKELLGPEIGYVDIFMHELTENSKKEMAKGRTKTPLRPSSAGKCSRELYFEMTEYAGLAKYPTTVKEPETELLLSLGHSIESHLIYHIRKHLSVCEVRYTQQSLDFGKLEALNDARLNQHLEGSMDLCLWSDKWKCVVDVKSKGDRYDFRARKNAWEVTDIKLDHMESVRRLTPRTFYVDDLEAFLNELQDPFFESNFKQLNLYCNSDFIKQRNIDHGAIIQYHKNASKLREIRFRPSEKVYRDTIAKFQNVLTAVDSGTINDLPLDYDPSSFKSRYCDFCKAKVKGSCANP